MSITALMYHAVPAAEPGDVTWDPHYAVTAARFASQLDALAADGSALLSVQALLAGGKPPACTTCLTFDDGGRTDYEVAFPLLAARDATADFFVSAGLVGTPGYASWAQLREMADAGMSIQSHGYAHRLLDDITDAEAEHEIAASRLRIEDALGRAVTLFAPPGGRLTSRAIAIARRAGYTAVCSSRPGRFDGTAAGFVLPRFAVLAGTPNQLVQDWARGEARAVLRERTKYRVTWLAKQLLGNQQYDRLRGYLLARG